MLIPAELREMLMRKRNIRFKSFAPLGFLGLLLSIDFERVCASVNDVNCYPQISLQIKNDHFVFDRLCLRWNDNTISFQCLLLHTWLIWHCWSTVMNLAQAYSMSHYLMFVDVFEFVSLSCARFSIPSRKIWVSILFPHVIILTTIETHTHTRTLTLENHVI